MHLSALEIRIGRVALVASNVPATLVRLPDRSDFRSEDARSYQQIELVSDNGDMMDTDPQSTYPYSWICIDSAAALPSMDNRKRNVLALWSTFLFEKAPSLRFPLSPTFARNIKATRSMEKRLSMKKALGDKIKRLELRIASFMNDSDVLKWRVGNLEAKIATLEKNIDQAVLDNQSRIEILET